MCVLLCSRDVLAEDSTNSDVTPPLEREMEGSAGTLDHRVPERWGLQVVCVCLCVLGYVCAREIDCTRNGLATPRTLYT